MQTYLYFDYKNEKIDTEGRIFRIRKKGTDHLYTIKKKEKNDSFRSSHEHEMKITDVDSFKRVLEKYGLKKVREKKKQRVSYAIEDTYFEFDKYL